VNATISPPVRVFALVGLLAATAFAAYFFLFSGVQTEPAAAETPAVTPATVPSTPKSKPGSPRRVQQTRTQAKPAVRPGSRPGARAATSGLPAAVQRAFRANRVVVVSVYMPGAAVDAHVRAQARAGAARARAGFVALSATSQRLVAPIIAKAGVLPQPAVVVLRRPGVVVATLGVTDSGTVAQTVLQAKRR
jgi:hypothetical protein